MRFMFGEGGWSYLERLTYRGFIGFFYENTLMGILTYCIIGLILIFAIIGFLTVIRFLFRGKKKGKKQVSIWQGSQVSVYRSFFLPLHKKFL